MADERGMLCGLEMEYAAEFKDLTVANGKRWNQMSHAEAELLFMRDHNQPQVIEDDDWGNTGDWSLTGARYYVDAGDHPEAATPESPDFLVADYERVNDLVLTEAVSRMEQNCDGRRAYRLFRNNLSENGESFGCHESYLLPRRIGLVDVARNLTPFRVTSQLFAGAGLVVPGSGRGGLSYQLTQRAGVISMEIGRGTTRRDVRGIWDNRDEPLAGGNWRRLHVISGDANILYTATVMKTRILALLLRMLSTGWRYKGPRVKDPVHAFRMISRDRAAVLPVDQGPNLRAVDIQRHCLEQAWVFMDQYGLTGYRPVLELWSHVLDSLRRNDLLALVGIVDWATKRQLIEREEEKLGRPIKYKEARRIDLEYHNLWGGDKLAWKVRRMYDPADMRDRIHRARTLPPPTRAKLRGRFVRAASRYNFPYTVGWDNLGVVLGDERVNIDLPNPLHARDRRVDQLISRLGETARFQADMLRA